MRSESLSGFGNKKRCLTWEDAAWEEGQGGVWLQVGCRYKNEVGKKKPA